MSNNGVSSQTPSRPVVVRTPRPSSHSRMIEDETTSRVSSSFTNRSPLALTRWPPSDRMPSVTSAPINCSGYTAPVGWYWKVSSCSSLAPIRYAIEQHAQIQEPLGDGGPFLDHRLQEPVVVLHMPAFERVEEVLHRRVLVSDSNLDPALGHDGIGVAKPELGGQQHLRAVGVRVQRGRATRA